ncbi:type IV pilus modification protein PilV [Simiduia sp. 21SJ11W-1]|uniref:type IV pilus modification protein PilV n=1 Tax=Simiduia sp. 21SJ11W-1 TaxID=2909669 RepID=UPI0020A18714|nr:type IV pilus modification protein PilV [Simiduia sp. 21SJ11W-1]UTA47335.1 type IV pilus modification protein PilV [Simiduia sp. 21SJ11W-1]
MHKQRGVTLIEILVTVAIMAVGLLGLGAMQLLGLKNINNSQYRTQASLLAYDMAERMRSNPAGVRDGHYDAVTNAATKPTCTVCSTEQMAQLDAFEWNALITEDIKKGGLPDTAAGTVTKNGNQWDVTVSWDEQTRDNTGGVVKKLEMTMSVRL